MGTESPGCGPNASLHAAGSASPGRENTSPSAGSPQRIPSFSPASRLSKAPDHAGPWRQCSPVGGRKTSYTCADWFFNSQRPCELKLAPNKRELFQGLKYLERAARRTLTFPKISIIKKVLEVGTHWYLCYCVH